MSFTTFDNIETPFASTLTHVPMPRWQRKQVEAMATPKVRINRWSDWIHSCGQSALFRSVYARKNDYICLLIDFLSSFHAFVTG